MLARLSSRFLKSDTSSLFKNLVPARGFANNRESNSKKSLPSKNQNPFGAGKKDKSIDRDHDFKHSSSKSLPKSPNKGKGGHVEKHRRKAASYQAQLNLQRINENNSESFQETSEYLEEERVRKIKEAMKLKELEELSLNTTDEAENFKLDVPWEFENRITKPEEGNLKSPIDSAKLINYSTVMALFKDYVQAIESYDIERLGELLERFFWDRCSKNLRNMQKRGYRFELQGIASKKNKVDLRKVSNYYCVGVHSNRKLNDGENNYMIFNNVIEGSPTKNIMKQRLAGNERAVIRVVLDIIVETPIKLKLFDKENNLVGKQVEEKAIDFHLLKLENDLFEAAYSDLTKSIGEAGELDEDSLNKFRTVFSQDGWRIIDFDNYMNGNDIIKPKVIM